MYAVLTVNARGAYTGGMNKKLGFIAWNIEITRITRIGAKPTWRQRLTAYRTYRSMP